MVAPLPRKAARAGESGETTRDRRRNSVFVTSRCLVPADVLAEAKSARQHLEAARGRTNRLNAGGRTPVARSMLRPVSEADRSSECARAPREPNVSRTRAAPAVEAFAQARAHDRGAHGRLRVAGAAVHRLPGGLGGAHRARCGSEAYLSSNFAGQLLPPPSASVVQYGYFRGGGFASDAAGLAAVGSFVFPTIGRFVLPLVALVLLLVTGEVSGSILLAGGLSLAISAIAGIAGYCFLRGERSARWLGARLQRPLSWILVKLKREPIADGAAQRRQNSVRRGLPSCARDGLWGRSGSRRISSSPT